MLAATGDAFEVLHFIAGKRLKAGKLTVVDATNVQTEARKPFVALAREYHCLPVAIVFNISEKICQDRNKNRSDRNFGSHVIRNQSEQLRRSMRNLEREGFRHVFILNTPEEVEAFTIERQKLWNNLREEHGPFDLIGDIHGCLDEMRQLLDKLGYQISELSQSNAGRRYRTAPPHGRKAVFLGDLVDRGKRIVETRLLRTVTIREENGIAALEVMSRFAANPKWLIYLPPTMSPSETTKEPGLLEHPAEAFAYFRKERVAKVVCEEKHMGSRAVIILCRDEESARKRLGIVGEGIGACYTRTGRRFLVDTHLEAHFLEALKQSLDQAGIWEEFNTGWACLDCELMPWSAKAQELIKDQYAAVGVAARVGLEETVATLRLASGRNQEATPLLGRFEERATLAKAYVGAYRRYCWPVRSLADFKLAPFHLLATEGAVHADKNHVWHMETLAKICRTNPIFLVETPFKIIELGNAESEQTGIQWWTELTGRGGEGMVVKPFDFLSVGRRGVVQPAIKCRGREYLRIIYGPEYTQPENLERLRARSLSTKRSLALREFALGLEALERFVKKEPLRRVHECVFGVLALESEPVDPRL
jgi:predicted kinase